MNYVITRSSPRDASASKKWLLCCCADDILSYFMDLSCIDTIEVILSDWRDTDAGTTENLKSGVLLYIYS